MGDAEIIRERCRRGDVLGCHIDAISWDDALKTVLDWAVRRESRYVCHCNVYSVVTARRDSQFQEVLNHADMATPDGMPIAWVLRLLGFAQQPRINGPDMMWRYCALAAAAGHRIYLYGSTHETLARLTKKLLATFPGLKIVGAEAPPFRELTPGEAQETVRRINDSGAHAVFVGLGCPRQERWMERNRGQIRAVMLGVGAAFDYHAGAVRRAPSWMREHGLEWLHRMVVEPRRLLRRYLTTNTLFLVYMTAGFLDPVLSAARTTLRGMFLVLLALLPSFIKVRVLRALGHDIGRNVHIGMSYLDIRKMVLRDGARIGSFNYFRGLAELSVMEQARVGGWGNCFKASHGDGRNNAGHGRLVIGRGSVITSRHYFDVQDLLVIGARSLIAGIGSVFYARSISPPHGKPALPVVIGGHCYVGSHCLFLPGAKIGSCTFVGVGTVVTRDFSDRRYVFLAGNPAMAYTMYNADAATLRKIMDHFCRPSAVLPIRAAAGPRLSLYKQDEKHILSSITHG